MTDLKDLLPSIKVFPFPEIQSEPYREAYVNCPKCLNRGDIYEISEYPQFLTKYCKGNLPPEMEHEGLFGEKHKHQIYCAGITDEHFHIKCNVCDYVFFLALPEENNNG